MTDNLFTDVPPVSTDVIAPDQLLATITNESGEPKYKSVQDALKALAASQEHIKRVEADNAKLRETTLKSTVLEDVLKAIQTPPAPAPAAPPQTKDQPDIATLVAQSVAQIEATKTATQNTNEVIAKMTELYGDTASESFYKKATELGMSNAEINILAARSPKAVFTLFGIGAKQTSNAPKGTINTDSFNHQPDNQTKRSGMAHGTTKQLVDAWKLTADRVNKELGIN